MAEPLEQTKGELRPMIEEALERWLLPDRDDLPTPLVDAIRYAVFPGGKRLRPTLALLACRAFGGDLDSVLPAAAALEMVHCYSLVHDDLPAMDDDEFRRGRPTCHMKFGEAMAILAGDALLTRGLEIVAQYSPPNQAARWTAWIASAAGVGGMVSGQAADLLAEGGSSGADRVRWIHRHKTTELIRVSVRVGASAGGADEEQKALADRYGIAVGHAFQIVDDLLGRSGTQSVTGKPIGKDDERGKLTYPAEFGEPAARSQVDKLTREAHQWASRLPAPRELQQLAARLRERVS